MSSLRKLCGWLLAAALVLLPACASLQRRAAGGCRWPVAAVTLHQAADTVVQSWTFEADRLPREVGSARLPALASFMDTVRVRVGSLDARALLERQVAFYAARQDADSQGETANGRLVLAGTAGTLRPIGCVEALLVEHQAARFPMASQPTEFHAVIMERNEAGRRWLRVYFAGSGAPWPPKARQLFERAEADRRSGWRAVAHLHNHPFLFTREDIAGANAPSLTDVQFWRHLRGSLGLESAWVTNGFATFEAPAAAFDLLQSR